MGNLASAMEVAQRISEACGGKMVLRIPAQPRIALTMALFSLAREHQKSITMLTAAKQYRSATALLRPLIEACARAVWCGHIASEVQIQKLASARDSVFPGLENLLRDVDPHETGLKHLLQRGMVHSFTHGGVLALSVHISHQGLGPEHPKKEQQVAIIVALSALLLGYSGVNVTHALGVPDKAEVI